MNSSAFYELIDVLQDKKKVDKIEEFIMKYSVEDIIFAFKMNGIGINAYPNSESYNEYINIRPIIYSKAKVFKKEILVEEYDKGIEIINLLFSDFYLSERFNVVNKVPDDKKLFAFLIMFEIYIRAVKDIKLNEGKNNEFYGDVELKKNIEGKVIGLEKLSANQFTDILDFIFQQSSKIIQAFIFYGYLYKNNNFVSCAYNQEIEWSDINNSFEYFSLIDIRSVIFNIFDEWKFGNYIVEQIDVENIKIMPKDIRVLINEKVESQRFEAFRQSGSSKHNKMYKENISEDIIQNTLAPDAFIDELERESYIEYLEFFSSDNLNYKVGGIEIIKWLRAYAVVRYYNTNYLNNNTFPDNNSPNSWLYISTFDEWVEKFVRYGIDEKNAQSICKKFIFKKKSVDWFDSPFIKIDDKIITVPSYASHIQDIQALISLATKEDLNLDFKGYCFENRVLNDLNNKNIPAISIKRKFMDNEYQCDVAFVLGKDLFLCECKHTSQATSQRKRYDFYNKKIPEDVKQLNRISDYYSSNVQYVIEELNKKSKMNYLTTWKPRYVYRIIIYSCKLGSGFSTNGVLITDYTVFTTLLYKRLPTVFKDDKAIIQFIPPGIKGVFEGKITTNKLINYIENPWQVDFQKEFTEVKDEIVPINKINLHRKRVSRTIDNYYNTSKLT